MKTRHALVALALTALAGCPTVPVHGVLPQPGVDWQRIDVAGDKLLAVIDTALAAYAHDPEVVKDLTDIRDVVAAVDSAVDVVGDDGGEANLALVVDDAVDLLDWYIKHTSDGEKREVYIALRLALGGILVLLA